MLLEASMYEYNFLLFTYFWSLTVCPEVNPFLVMVDFDKAAINALYSTFLL